MMVMLPLLLTACLSLNEDAEFIPTDTAAPYWQLTPHARDEGVHQGPQEAFLDADGDGYGDAAASRWYWGDLPEGFVHNGDDCNDADAFVHEVEDWYLDRDGDGYGEWGLGASCGMPDGWGDEPGATVPGDCDDHAADVHPGQVEICDNDIDDDCDGISDICPMNTEDLVYDDCSRWTPYDQEGAQWRWSSSQSSRVYTATVTAAGLDTYEGLEVWLLEVWGSRAETTQDYAEAFEGTIAVTCEADGVHLVYQDWHWSASSHGYTSSGERFTQFTDRPRMFHTDFSRDASWVLSGVDIGSGPVDRYERSADEAVTFQAIDLDDVEIDGVTYSARQVNITDTNGNVVRSWFVEGVGLVKMDGGYQVSAFYGL